LTEPSLVCPYTGETMTIVTSPGLRVRFSLRGGFDPAALSRDRGKLERAIRMRSGRVTPAKTCPYLGTKIRVAEVQGHPEWFRVEGTYWTPRALFSEKQELLYAVSTRGGVPPAFPRELPRLVARRIEEPPASPLVGLVSENMDTINEFIAGGT
jgi:hypothetical protein